MSTGSFESGCAIGLKQHTPTPGEAARQLGASPAPFYTAAMATAISVEYCVSCNYLPRALWMIGEILAEIGGEIAELRLVPGDRGVFDWHVDGEVVFSKTELGRFPEIDELKEALYARLDP
jgi:selenoprotein W-related protein